MLAWALCEPFGFEGYNMRIFRKSNTYKSYQPPITQLTQWILSHLWALWRCSMFPFQSYLWVQDNLTKRSIAVLRLACWPWTSLAHRYWWYVRFLGQIPRLGCRAHLYRLLWVEPPGCWRKWPSGRRGRRRKPVGAIFPQWHRSQSCRYPDSKAPTSHGVTAARQDSPPAKSRQCS